MALSRASRDTLFLLLITGALLIFAFNGRRPLFDTSEARYAEVARAMAREGHWMIPHLGETAHLTKPPLAYWIVAVPMTVFGTSEWVPRLMPGVFFLITVLLTYDLARRMLQSEASGLIAAWLALLSLVPLGTTNTITTDTFLTTFELSGVWAFWRCIQAPQPVAARRWTTLFYVLWGAVFMVKGPPGLLPLIPIIAFGLVFRKKYSWAPFMNPMGIVLGLLIALSWYVAVLTTVPDAARIWRTEVIQHNFQSADRSIPRYYYFLILLLGGLPGTAALPWAIKDLRREQAQHVTSEWRIFAWIWLLIPLLIFCLSKQRLYLYVLPLFPPVMILCTDAITRRWLPDGNFRWVRVPRWAIAMMVTAGALVFAQKLYYAARPGLDRNFRPLARLIAADALKRGTKPQLIITMPYMGLGLLYYLDGPSVYRFEKSANRVTGKNVLLEKSFEKAVPAGFTQYVIVKDDEVERYNFVSPYTEAGIQSGPWRAWRRTTNSAVDVQRPPTRKDEEGQAVPQ